MADLQTNLNVAPFFDDYNEDKEYYRILFRPATPVQARELTQLQTIIQKQISRFGDSIYKDGSIVEGCNFTQYPNLPQVRFKDSNSATLDFSTICINNTQATITSFYYTATDGQTIISGLDNNQNILSYTGSTDVYVNGRLLTINIDYTALDGSTITLSNALVAGDIVSVIAYAGSTSSHLSQSYLLVSNATGLRAAVFQAIQGSEASANYGSFNTNRSYVLYLNSGNSAGQQVSVFSSNAEQIDVYNFGQDKQAPLSPGNYVGSIFTLQANSSVNTISVGYGIHVGQGVIYQKGFFLKTDPGNFVIKEHSSNAAGVKVGFSTAEYIIKPSEDPSLYDNSIGSTNYSAPGAYRLKLIPSLVSYDTTNTAISVPTGFLPVVDFSGGTGAPTTIQTDQYSVLGDMIAQRTKEEAGDYIVKPFQVNVEASGNPNTFFYTASPGIGYIDGYRVEYKTARRIEVARGVSTQDLIEERATVNFGNYVLVNEVAGIFDIGGLQTLGIYDTQQNVLSQSPFAQGPAGNQIGTAVIRAFMFDSGTKGTTNAQYRLYISNITMNSGHSFAQARSFYAFGTYGRVYADIVPVNGQISVQGSKGNLIFDTGLNGVKRLTSNTGVNNTSYIYRSTLSPSNLVRVSSNNSTASFTISSDQFNYGVGYVDDVSSQNINVFFNTDVVANLTSFTGTVTTSNSTTSTITVPNVSAAFDQILKIGNNLKLSLSPYEVAVANVNSANSIIVTPAVSGGISTSINRFFKQGSLIDFTGSGNTIQFVSVAGKVTQMNVSLALGPDPAGSYSLRAQVPIVRTAATPIKKVVYKNNYVNINCASHAANTVGPWTLGFPDVYNITGVYVGAGFANTNPNRVDWFDFNNGQTDNYYGLSQISIKPQYSSGLTSASRLTVQFDCFSPNITSSQATFFSVDSYPIDDANTNNTNAIVTAQIPLYIDGTGNKYDLRNYIDVRPVVTNTVVFAVNASSAAINPSNSNPLTFYQPTTPIVIEPDSNFTYNVEFYLPRYDALLITKDGSLISKSGTPSFTPKQPTLNNSGLKIADILVPPYPSLTFTEAE